MQESNATWRVPYQFTSKEMDQETGLYYFGARYYDPRTSVWQSPDPILAKYLPSGGSSDPSKLAGMGGAFNSKNLGFYSYVAQNPIKFTDPDGKELAAPSFSQGTFTGTMSYPLWDKTVVRDVQYIVATAQSRDIPLKVVSGYRSYETQARLRVDYEKRLDAAKVRAEAEVKAFRDSGATGPSPDVKRLTKDYAGTPAAKPGTSQHESGFGLDVNWADLTAAQKLDVLGIANSRGFVNRPDINDALHFEAQPSAHGYTSNAEAIRENNTSFKSSEGQARGAAASGLLLKLFGTD